jgi:organic hydroperoxide reductase OsmC/OhrA
MGKFPINFEVSSEATSGIQNKWKIQSNAYESITCCIAAEFSGPGGGYTPEDFFALAAMSCITAAFKVNCEKAKENFEKIKLKSKLTLDLDCNNKLSFTALDITIEVIGSSNIENVKKALESAINDCPVSNSIKTPKMMHIDIK